MVKKYQLYVNGEFVDSMSKETMDVINPANEETISSIPMGTEEDVNHAIECCPYGFPFVEKVPSKERASYLYKIADKIGGAQRSIRSDADRRKREDSGSL